jgi:hypothetical protein
MIRECWMEKRKRTFVDEQLLAVLGAGAGRRSGRGPRIAQRWLARERERESERARERESERARERESEREREGPTLAPRPIGWKAMPFGWQPFGRVSELYLE